MAPSELAWLDFSEAEQRRAREAVQLFAQRDSRDELGTGVLRDIISERLFPGISVLHQRARYFLFIPWIFVSGAQSRTGKKLLDFVDQHERKLIEALMAGGDERGLIGREAGYRLKTLPSTMYWNALQHYGVLRQRASKTDVARFQPPPKNSRSEATEEAVAIPTMWSPTLPSAPKGFPQLDSIDFQLTETEAAWLVDRLLEHSAGSLLQWLVESQYEPQGMDLVWDEFPKASIPAEHFRVVTHAKHLALAVRGAALLYNYMLAELLENQGKSLTDGSAVFASELMDWSTEFESEQLWRRWDRADFWKMCAETRPVPPSVVDFVEQWSLLASSNSAEQLIASKEARLAIHSRERGMKRARARLDNPKQLAHWGGRSGTALYTYRWSQVSMLLSDLAEVRSRV